MDGEEDGGHEELHSAVNQGPVVLIVAVAVVVVMSRVVMGGLPVVGQGLCTLDRLGTPLLIGGDDELGRQRRSNLLRLVHVEVQR